MQTDQEGGGGEGRREADHRIRQLQEKKIAGSGPGRGGGSRLSQMIADVNGESKVEEPRGVLVKTSQK